MVERSSPGMYWRYSANSTLNPLNGLRCRPDRNPSTMVRAFSSSVPRRATTAGSRKGRSCAVQGVIRIADCGWRTADWDVADWSHSTLRRRHALEQPIDDRVGVDALRLGVEVRHDAVAEDWFGERLDVLDRHVIAPMHQRACLRAAHQRLGSAQAGAPLHPLVDE